ncbi:Beta-lactamase class C and other penicillin binding protein-like protein OS=Streptomyces glaucescens OX=1907 GN=SGLAU_01895 PE=4 SV=1 [Streptomyces glaucescens]
MAAAVPSLDVMIIRRSSVPAALLGLAVASLPSSAAASAAPDTSGLTRSVQRDADALREAGVTGVAVRLETPGGTVTARSGVGDLATGRPVPESGYLRLGSTTKTFVATVVLQLVGEQRISLDQTVEQLLPEVVSGPGHDGRAITVRQLLQHTSGLPDYVHDVFPEPSARTYFAHRWRAYRPEELVRLALRHEPAFPPGTGWAYSNTNYVLAGMIIEKVTGRAWERQVHDRVLRPLGLRHTDTPGTWPFLPQPHAADYQQFTADGPMIDTTLPYRPFDSGADGSMTGTARDLNRFFGALAEPCRRSPPNSPPCGPRSRCRGTAVIRRAPGTGWVCSSPPCPAGADTWGTGERLRIRRPCRHHHGRTAHHHRLRAQPLDGSAGDGPSGRALNDLVDHALCHTG